MNTNELYHFGIKRRSGRYPWGSGDRPYQSSGGSASAPKKKSNRQLKKEQIAAGKAEKARLEAIAKEKALMADKERVLREGTATEVMQYQGKLTNQELQQAFTRLDWERKISNYSKDELNKAFNTMDSAMSKVKKVTGWGAAGIDLYNMMAAVYNSTSDKAKSDPLPIISRSDGSSKKKDKK